MGELLESANLLPTIIAIFGIYMNWHWRHRTFDEDTRKAIYYWNWIYLSMGVRAGYFWLIWLEIGALKDGVFEQTWLVGNRVWIVILTSLGFAYGVIGFVRLIEEKSKLWLFFIYSGIIGLSVGLGHFV